MEFGIIFAMGTDLDSYYCRLDAQSPEGARQAAAAVYPFIYTHVLPFDSRFEAHIKTYKKTEIPFGHRKILAPAPAIPPVAGNK